MPDLLSRPPERLLSLAAAVLLAGVVAGVFAKVRLDEQEFARQQRQPAGVAPLPSVPAGLDGRPLDPNAVMPDKPPRPPPADASKAPRGKAPRPKSGGASSP